MLPIKRVLHILVMCYLLHLFPISLITSTLNTHVQAQVQPSSSSSTSNNVNPTLSHNQSTDNVQKTSTKPTSGAVKSPTDKINDLFSPKYFTGLFKLVDAEIKPVLFANGTSNVCQYVSTPREGTDRYDCEAGSFCPYGPSSQTPCSLGFYCPPNTAQPLYCCAGYYCPTPKSIFACPENHYCPKASTRPFSCQFIAHCPEGTESPRRLGVFLVVVGFVIIAWLILTISNRHHSIRSLKYVQSMASVNESIAKKRMTVVEIPRQVTPRKRKHILDIQFSNLGLTLHNGMDALRGVSGELKAGRVCCVLGPSGSGKTTFFNVLRGSIKRTDGIVRINGVEAELRTHRKLIGFVPQDDVMIRELKVVDTLMYSAKTRLPSNRPHAEIKNKVLESIEYLGLGNVMNQIIGTEKKRGLSGGQCKRTNIGIELVAEPLVLLLDEPTSGLDSSTSIEICSLLRSIARDQYITIAAIVHSPPPTAFEAFDDLILLAKGGRAVYVGERLSAMTYFTNLGYECPINMNHADFLLDVVSGKLESSNYGVLTPSDLVRAWDQHASGKEIDLWPDTLTYTSSTSSDFFPEINSVGMFSNLIASVSDLFTETCAWVKNLFEEFVEWSSNLWAPAHDPIRQAPSTIYIFWQCFRRASFQIYRTPTKFILDQILHLGCGALISIATENLDYLGKQPKEICDIAPAALRSICENPIDNLRNIGVFMSLGVMFAGISVATNTFGTERMVYWRETSSGRPTLPYFFAKVLADLPRIILAAFMFTLSLILFWPYRSHFMTIYAIVLLLYFCSFQMGYVLSIWIDRESVGLVGTGFALLWSLVLSGLVPSLDHVVQSSAYHGIAWLWAISPPRYAIEALYVKEVAARPFPETQLQDQLYTYKLSNYFPNLFIMFGLGCAWCFITLISLKLADRSKFR